MTDLSNILRDVAPALAAALGGPLAGAAVAYLSAKIGVAPEMVQQTVSGFKPENLVHMRELDIQFQEFMAENGIKLQLANIDVNKEEAKSVNWFVAGWRPAVGWICGIALFYAAVLEPVARFFAVVLFGYIGAFPEIDTDLSMQILLGMLGLAAARTVEKTKNSEGAR